MHTPSQELLQRKGAEVSAFTAPCIYLDLLASIWAGGIHKPHQWGDFQGPNCCSGTECFLPESQTQAKPGLPSCEGLPGLRLHFPSCCRCTSEGCGNQRQTKYGGDRPRWRARLSNRVGCLKPFAILDRNNLRKSPQQGSVGAAKEITNQGPITESRWLLQRDLCYLNVMVAMMNLLSSGYRVRTCTS